MLKIVLLIWDLFILESKCFQWRYSSCVTKSQSLWAVSLEHTWLKGHFWPLPKPPFCLLLLTFLLSPQLPGKVLEGRDHVFL